MLLHLCVCSNFSLSLVNQNYVFSGHLSAMCQPSRYQIHENYLYQQSFLQKQRHTLLNKNALPVAPVNRVDISSLRLVNEVSHVAHANSLDPPMCSKNIRPIGKKFLTERKLDLKLKRRIWRIFVYIINHKRRQTY